MAAPPEPPLFGGRPARSAPVRPGRILGNRDWIIPIECRADAVILYPTRKKIPVAQLAQGDGLNNPLFQEVQRLIERRQAMILPGDPPYRPIVRFLVRPDATQSYYLAYPCLEGLQVPMKRVNLDEQEEIKPDIYRP